MPDPLTMAGGGATVYCGDPRAVLATLPENSVQCCITSPPYYALRSYLPKDHPDKPKEMGSEKSPAEYTAKMVEVFREVRRVLRDDGLLFLNMGDGYAANRSYQVPDSKWHDVGNAAPMTVPLGYQAADLLNIPHLLAEALRADGWLWRQTIVWAKRSPMPESVKGWRWERHRVKIGESNKAKLQLSNMASAIIVGSGAIEHPTCPEWRDCPGCEKCAPNGGYILRRGMGRCTTAHEYIFVLAKTGGYFWDSYASREPATSISGGACVGKVGSDGPGSRRLTDDENMAIRGGDRNPRSVWWLSSEPTKLKHYAAFPSELVRRCLLAGVGSAQCCPVCEAPFAPVVEHNPGWDGSHYGERAIKATGGAISGGTAASTLGSPHGALVGQSRILGYRPTCLCQGRLARWGKQTCLVLDPFCGTGRTGQVALQMGCRFIGIDLNPEYIDFSRKTLAAVSMDKLDVLTENPADAPLLRAGKE